MFTVWPVEVGDVEVVVLRGRWAYELVVVIGWRAVRGFGIFDLGCHIYPMKRLRLEERKTTDYQTPQPKTY